MAVSFTLNGLAQTLDLDPDTPLIYALRNDLLMHGAKFGCGLEQCGACLVLINGEPAYACATTVGTADSSTVETIEGLADPDGKLHPIQQAFVELNAAQCGYCIAGIIMRVKSLLDLNPHPTTGETRKALDGHLCRCGAHPRILRAVERAIAIRQVKSL